MGVLDDAKDNVKGYVKGVGEFLSPPPEVKEAFSPSIDTKPKSPGVEYAQRQASKSGDTATAASTVGVTSMQKTKGAANKTRSGGSDESGMSHQSNPQRAAWEDGHAVNHMYKNPAATIGSHKMNHSYMHPLQNPDAANAPALRGKDPTVSTEKELKTKPANGIGGKVVFSPQLGKNKA